MGWIRDRMERLDSPLTSFSELARKVRNARSWPQGDELKPASLAIYLRSLDEGEGLDRLEQRPGVIDALAEVLEMPAEDMEDQLGRLRASQSEPSPPFKLHDMPVRLINLREDPLPPGIPQGVSSPKDWPLWWYAPSGSGRTWVGRWLEARALATFIQAPTWADAERQLPSEGAVFIELGSTEGVPLQDRWAPKLKICVATEAYPPQPSPSPESVAQEQQQLRRLWAQRKAPPGQSEVQEPLPKTWPLLKGLPVSSWLHPLMEWLKERATGDAFDTEACLTWLQETKVLSEGDDLGTVLGLIGLYATFVQGPGSAGPLYKARSRADMARLFVRMRKLQVEEAPLSVDALWPRLRTLGQRLLLEGEGPWFEARPMDVWQTLARTRPDGSDLEWLSELGAHGLSVDPAALNKARERLPPDAFRTIRALRDLGLLREREPQMYALRPRWVLDSIIEEAIRDTIDQEAPGTWGTILLRQDGAALAMQHVLDRCRQGRFECIEKVVAAPDTSSPAWVAALEASFRMLGLAILEGIHVPEALRQGVLSLQQRLLIPSSEGAPYPRLGFAHQLEQQDYLLSLDVWFAALLVLAEPLPSEDELSLESWSQRLPEHTVRWMVEMVTMSSRGPGEVLAMPWLMDLLLLGGRLFDRLSVPEPEEVWPPDLFWPESVLRVLQQQQPSLTELEHLLSGNWLAKHLPDYTRQHAIAWGPLARNVWRSWLAQESAPLPNFLMRQEEAEIFWRELPAEAVRRFIPRNLRWILQRVETYAFFQTEHWDVFVEAWASLEQSWWSDPPRAAWQFIPAEHVRKALQAGLPDKLDHGTRQELWARMPEVFCEEIDALFKQGRWAHALMQAWEVPPPFFMRILDSAEMAVTQADSPPPWALSWWLRDKIRVRVPGWERAWKLLERLRPTMAPTTA